MSDDTRTIHQFLGPDHAAMTPDELAAYIEADEKRGRPAMRSQDEIADAFEQIETRRWYGRGVQSRLNSAVKPEQRIERHQAVCLDGDEPDAVRYEDS